MILRPISFINESQAPDPEQFAIDPRDTGVLVCVGCGGPLWPEDIRPTLPRSAGPLIAPLTVSVSAAKSVTALGWLCSCSVATQ